MAQLYICFNGSFFPEGEPVLSVGNRAFAYGDALFETIHCLGTEPQFMDKHWERLTQGMQALKMLPGDLVTREKINHYIGKLLNKNRYFKGARIRLVVFRNEGGLYAPDTMTVSWTMESSPLPAEHYVLNKKGLVADIFDGVLKPVNRLSGFKTANGLIYVLAGIYRNENKLGDCFILNHYGRITETNHSNLFIYRDDMLVTPPLSEGCVAGTMRSTLVEITRNTDLEIHEKVISEQDLLNAEEIFVTNAIQGIQWIGAYKDKRFFNFISRKLIARLNEHAFGSSAVRS